MTTPATVTPTPDAYEQATELSTRGALVHLAGNRREALALYSAALALDPKHPTALNNMGFLLAQEGQLAQAIEYLDRSLEQRPRSVMALINLGNAHAAQGELDSAIGALREAVQIEPLNPLAQHSLGRVLLASGSQAEAEEACRAAVTLAPDTAEYLLTLGTVVGARGRMQEAVTILEAATALNPESADAWAQLGVARLLRQDLGSATDALRCSLGLRESSRGRFQLALALLARGDVDTAAVELERAVRLEPENYRVALDLAVVRIAQRRWTDALTNLERARDTGSSSPRLEVYRAMALDGLGHTDEATGILQELMQDSDHEAAAAASEYWQQRSER
jgi:tetratricopeptide (TPR) repeat protein